MKNLGLGSVDSELEMYVMEITNRFFALVLLLCWYSV